MKKLCLKLCQSQPASGHSPAGNARVPMTDEEKMRQRNRLLKTPASVKEHASSLAARWITDQLAAYGFDPFDGPFSEKEMKGDAIWIICTESYRAIYDGEWRWPENRKLSTQMIQIAKSKMAHIVRDFNKRDKAKDDLHTSQMTYTQLMKMEEAAGQWEMESNMIDFAYEIAEKAVADHPLFLRFLKSLREYRCYDLMADDLGLSEREVLRIEKQLLKYLERF